MPFSPSSRPLSTFAIRCGLLRRTTPLSSPARTSELRVAETNRRAGSAAQRMVRRALLVETRNLAVADHAPRVLVKPGLDVRERCFSRRVCHIRALVGAVLGVDLHN